MKKILVADDNKSIQVLLQEELVEEGYQVFITGNPSQIMMLINQKRPDLVILDIRFDGHSGLDLLQDIKNTFDNLPVILCTAYPNFKYDMKSIAADYYVVKSPDLSEIKSKVKMALGGLREIPASLPRKSSSAPGSKHLAQIKSDWFI